MSSHTRPRALETNLSWLFLTPDRVYKVLRPVELPFVDHRDPAVRAAAAQHEFEVNAAISPDVYLDVVPVHDGAGDVEDRMIVMRRLADDDCLTRARGEAELTEALRHVAKRIAGIHAGLDPLHGDEAGPARAERILRNWEDNLEVLNRHRDTIVSATDLDRVAELARNYVAGRHALFERREEQGWVRSGHGDLRAEHVYVEGDDVQLIDALAFTDEYRVSDVLSDVAFLAMDLDRLFGTKAAVTLMRFWGEFTNEHHPSSLAHFYVAYRAHVRAKVACLAFEGGDPNGADWARIYHRIALRHLEHALPRLVLVGGGAGTGKSTIAEGLAKRVGAMWLRADEIRKDLAGMGHDDHAFAAPGEGIYTPEMNAKVSDEIARRARLLLGLGESVVLDATWGAGESRGAMRTVANERLAEVDELRCEAPIAICKERIARRMAMVHNPSDASPEVVDHIAANFDDWPEARVIDTNRAIATSLDEAVDAVMGRPSNTSQHPERFFLDVPAVQRLTGLWLLHEGLAPISPDPRRT